MLPAGQAANRGAVAHGTGRDAKLGVVSNQNISAALIGRSDEQLTVVHGG